MAESEDSIEKRRAYMRAWRAANREKACAYQRAWYAADPKRAREKARKNLAQKRLNPQLLAYNSHRGNARLRNVEFLITFEEWWAIWDASGKWEQRGARRGGYVMGRFGDEGPYAPGNVKIHTHAENNAERNRASRGKPPSAAKLAAMAAARAVRWAHGRTISDRQREALAKAQEVRWTR